MIEMGIIVGLGLLVSLFKMNWVWRMKLLSRPLTIDTLIFVLLLAIHWGTFSGVMVATIGAFMCSLILSGARFLFGYVDASGYVPGVFNVSSKL